MVYAARPGRGRPDPASAGLAGRPGVADGVVRDLGKRWLDGPLPLAVPPHPFLATSRVDSRNINIIIPGVTFQDSKGQAILATHLGLPDDLNRFLNRKGFQILTLVLS